MKGNENMTIGEKIKKLRLEKGISQEELAKIVNTTKQAIYKYESNVVTNIPISKIQALAEFFNVSPAYLTGWGIEEEEIEEFTKHEKRVIKAYRNKPEMQPAVDKLLGVENTDALTEDMKNTADKINFPIKQK